LTGGADNGAATLGLGSGYALPQQCSPAAVPKWSGSAWACGTDQSQAYDGHDFALSNQACNGQAFVWAIGSDGHVACAVPASPTLAETVVRHTVSVTGGSCAPFAIKDLGDFCAASQEYDIFASCPAGTKAVAGGYTSGAGYSADGLIVYDDNPTLTDPSDPASGASGWHVRLANYQKGQTTIDVTAYAICAALN
jgi:hypothetical protein